MSAESSGRGSFKNDDCDIRGSSRVRERDDSLAYRDSKAHEALDSYHSGKNRDTSASRNRGHYASGPSSLEQKLEASRLSRDRGETSRSRRSSMTKHNRSSSSYSRSTTEQKSSEPSQRYSSLRGIDSVDSRPTLLEQKLETRSQSCGRSATSRSRRSSMTDHKYEEQKSSVSSRRHSSEITSLRGIDPIDSRPSLLEQKLETRTQSCGRNATSRSRRSSMTDDKRSSSSYSRSSVAVSKSSTKSLRPKSSVPSRRHSAEVTSSRSICSTRSRARSVTSRRRMSSEVTSEYDVNSQSSAADKSARSNSVGHKSSISRRHSTEVSGSRSVCNMKVKRYDTAPLSCQPDEMKKSDNNTESVTSSEEEQHISRGRSFLSSVARSYSRSRGRSRSKPRGDDDNSILSLGRSFVRSISRQRSLSRSASRVLTTTSAMDGGYDDEPCPQRYEVPFNPSTGACNYHPEFTIALKNKGGKGGWRIIADGCPKCQR